MLGLSALTVAKEAEYKDVSRGDLQGLFDVWGSASATLDNFFFEQLKGGEGYSYAVYSGSSIYMFEVSSGYTADKMRVKINQYE